MEQTQEDTGQKAYTHIDQLERDRIQSLLDQKISHAEIARIIGRHKSTVGREIARNKRSRGDIPVVNAEDYESTAAQHKAYVSRKYAKYEGKKINEHRALQNYIVAGLQAHWNPDEISGNMKRLNKKPATALGFYASKTAIYAWLYSAWGQPYCQYLDSAQYKPKKRHPKAIRAIIPDRVSITERPLGATNRSRYGHYEGDTMVSGKRTGATAAFTVIHERKARYLDVRKIANLRPSNFNAAVTAMQESLQTMRSLSLDNGIENRSHAQLDTNTYFCDPYSSWQKGGVENSNGLLRAFFPKGCDLGNYTETQIATAVAIINNKPRKILGYKSAVQVMTERGLLRQTE